MGNMKRRFIEESYKKEPWFRALCSAILANKNVDDLANFLRDLATLSELKFLSVRMEIAKELSLGLSYRQISKNTGASTATVTRVASFLENGSGGYRKILHTYRHHRLRDVNVLHKSAEPYSSGKSSNKDYEQSLHIPIREERKVSLLQKYLK